MRQFSLEYDTDYGSDHRSGWTVVVDGSVLVQLTSLRACLVAFVSRWWRGRGWE